MRDGGVDLIVAVERRLRHIGSPVWQVHGEWGGRSS